MVRCGMFFSYKLFRVCDRTSLTGLLNTLHPVMFTDLKYWLAIVIARRLSNKFLDISHPHPIQTDYSYITFAIRNFGCRWVSTIQSHGACHSKRLHDLSAIHWQLHQLRLLTSPPQYIKNQLYIQASDCLNELQIGVPT